MIYDIRYMIYDIWYMTYDIYDIWYMIWYMKYDIWYDIWYMMVCLHFWRRGLRLSRVSWSLCSQQHQMVIDAWVTVQKSFCCLWPSQLLCDRDVFSVFFWCSMRVKTKITGWSMWAIRKCPWLINCHLEHG